MMEKETNAKICKMCAGVVKTNELMLLAKCCLQVLSEILYTSPGSTAMSGNIWTHVLATPNYPVEIFGLVQCKYSEAEKRKDDAGLEHLYRL